MFLSSKRLDLFVAGKQFARGGIDASRTNLASLVKLEAEASVVKPQLAAAKTHIGAL